MITNPELLLPCPNPECKGCPDAPELCHDDGGGWHMHCPNCGYWGPGGADGGKTEAIRLHNLLCRPSPAADEGAREIPLDALIEVGAEELLAEFSRQGPKPDGEEVRAILHSILRKHSAVSPKAAQEEPVDPKDIPSLAEIRELLSGEPAVIPKAAGWIKCTDRLPLEGELVWVYTPDRGDGSRCDFDYREEGGWAFHDGNREHFLAVGGSRAAGPDATCVGPDEEAAYTYWALIPDTSQLESAAISGDKQEKERE